MRDINILSLIESEIRASKKSQKAINLQLVNEGGVYKAYTNFKLEGDYALSSHEIESCVVQVERNGREIIVNGIDSDKPKLNVFLEKDQTALMVALKDKIKRNNLSSEPAFIIGPPGTGKTKVITETIRLALQDGKKVLVVSPTNMAVENVFERIDIEELGLEDGDAILTIKTEHEELKHLNPKEIAKRKIESVQDEIDVLEMALEEVLKQVREAETVYDSLKEEEELKSTMIANLQSDKRKLTGELLKLEKEAKAIENRIKAVNSNALIQSVATLFLKDKTSELETSLSLINSKKESVKEKIEDLSSKLKLHLESKKISDGQFDEFKEKMSKSKQAKREIEKEVKKLREQISQIRSNNFLSRAKLVGSTLISAALNNQIQQGDFDMVIVDEASMALVPTLVAVSQALKKEDDEVEVVEKEYEVDESYTKAQTAAVKLALKNKLVLVGDSKQLSPIAQTEELKKSIFDLYGVYKIFEGERVDNTVFLDINFRNHPSIVKLASKLFYGGLLKHGKKEDGKTALYIKRSSSNMILDGRSYINVGNAAIVYEQIKRALERGRRDIGVITPYRKQVERIEKSLLHLREEYPDADIQVGTIYTFQGKEKEIIIFDMVYSPSKTDKSLPKAYKGEVDSTAGKLLNVAMTRAESFFILVGDISGILELDEPESILIKWVKEIKELNDSMYSDK